MQVFVLDDRQQSLGFIGSEFFIANAGYDVDGSLKLNNARGGPVQCLFIERISFDEMIAENVSCPDPELRSLSGSYPITDRNDDIKVVESQFPRNPTVSLSLNY